jgi:YD repeat-containing protein
VLLELWLDDATSPAGRIVELTAAPGTPMRWTYVLADGRATGLHSVNSRSDLESRILEYYFHDLASDQRHSA